MMFAAGDSRQAGLWRVGLIAVLVLPLGLVSALSSAVEVLRNRAPEQALAIFENDAKAIVRRIDVKMSVSASAPPADMLIRDGRRAIKNSPLTAGAVRLIGMGAAVRGDDASAKKLYRLSERISRRDLNTQLMLIETAVRDQDIPGALRHYDTVLRTHTGAEGLLFPILAKAIEDPAIRRPFAAFMRQPPRWLGSFLSSTIRAGGHSAAVASIIEAGGGLAQVDRSGELAGLLLQGLAADRKFDALKRFYLSIPGAARERLSSAEFSDAAVRSDHAPISWQVMQSDALSANFTKESGRRLDLSLTVDTGQQVLVVRKLLFLAPGAYRFSGQIRPDTWIPGSSVKWILRCALTKEEPILWEGKSEGGRAETIADATMLLRDCPVQFLDLVATAGSEGQQPLEVTVESPSLVRVAGTERDAS